MTLIPMPETQIFEFIDACFLNKKYTIQITLIDGKTFLGTIPSQVTIFKPATNEEVKPSSSERCFLNDCLIIDHNEVFNEHSIYIPLDIIAGISSICYHEKTLKSNSDIDVDFLKDNLNYSNVSIRQYMFQDLLTYAIKLKLKVVRHHLLYSLGQFRPIVWGDLSYKSDTALYADWHYLQNISGGVNALGVGIGVFSLSSGWSDSLWNQFKKKVKQKNIDICEINTENEAVVKGYISFVKRYSTPHSIESSIDFIEMEGSKWIPAIISAERIVNTSDIKTNIWTLIYLKEDGLMFPLNAWDKISNPITVYCEVIHITISTEFGTIPFYLKARCAAYIKE